MTERRESGTDLDADCIRSALKRILSSETFARSPKVSHLLGYLVERRLAGDEDGLKEARIAQNVFGRPDEFNPRSNPIVRVNASRLRNLLRLYYAGPGQTDDERILLPDVGYSPVFPDSAPATERHLNEPSAPRTTADAAANNGQDTRAACDCSQDGDGAVQARHEPAVAAPGRRGRVSAIIGRQGVLALVLANLVFAGAFAVLANRSNSVAVHHVLGYPAQAEDAANEPALFMLCDRSAPEGSEPADAYPIAIGEDTFLCWPLQLRQSDRVDNPI